MYLDLFLSLSQRQATDVEELTFSYRIVVPIY